jgi:hypothetical protein
MRKQIFTFLFVNKFFVFGSCFLCLHIKTEFYVRYETVFFFSEHNWDISYSVCKIVKSELCYAWADMQREKDIVSLYVALLINNALRCALWFLQTCLLEILYKRICKSCKWWIEYICPLFTQRCTHNASDYTAVCGAVQCSPLLESPQGLEAPCAACRIRSTK